MSGKKLTVVDTDNISRDKTGLHRFHPFTLQGTPCEVSVAPLVSTEGH